MNNYTYIKKLSLLHKNSQTGSTLVIGVALGALMIGATGIAIATSSRAKTNVISDEGAKQAQAVAEGGINRTLSMFTQGNNKYLLLGRYSNGSWAKISDILIDDPNRFNDVKLPVNPCLTNKGTKVTFATNTLDWLQGMIDDTTLAQDINISSIKGSKGKNTFSSYTYVPGQKLGRLVIDGSIDNTQSQARYEATFAVDINSESELLPPPGAAALMASNMTLNQMDIFANTVICTDPTKCNKATSILPPDSCQDGRLSVDTSQTYSSMSAEDKATHKWLEASLGITNNGKIRDTNNAKAGNILIAETTIPPIPIAPVGARIIEVEYSTAGAKRNIVTSASANDPVNITADFMINLPTASVTLPRFSGGVLVKDAPTKGTLTMTSQGAGGGTGSQQNYTYTVTNPSSIISPTIDTFSFNNGEKFTVKINPSPINPPVKGKSNKAEDTTFTANGSKIATPTTIDMANSPYNDSFSTETIEGETYDIWYIQVNNYSGNNDLDVRVDNLNSVGNPNHKKQIRLYIGGNLNMQGNASIQAVDGTGKRITGSTEAQLNQISSLRIIGGFANPNMNQPTFQTWNFKGTTCTMGLIHAPAATINYSGGGNGCGPSGGENPVTLNNVFGVTGSPFGGSTATPNHFGTMWVKELTPNNSNAMALYENNILSSILTKEFGTKYFIGGNSNSFEVEMGDSILSLTRLPMAE